MQTRDWIWFGIAWFLFMVFVNPIGAFPLNDDWGYAKVVKHLVETGEYSPGTWPVMTLFTQALWGAFFASIFGFSFTVLRISTLVLAIIGSYWIFRESFRMSGDRYWAWLTLFSLVLNPLYFNLSFTFMTDVPFTVGIIGAILLFRRALEHKSIGYWLAACLATTAATLIRQPALLLVPAFGLVAIWQRPAWRSVLWAIGGVVLSYGALLWYVYFVGLQGETPGAPDSLGPLLRRLRFPLFGELFVKRGGMIIFYVSIFLFPLVLLRSVFRMQGMVLKPIWIRSTLAIATTLLFAIYSWSEIPAGNIIGFFGLGPTPMFGQDNRFFDASAVPFIIWPTLRIAGYAMMLLLFWWIYGRLHLLASWRKWPARTYWKMGLFLFILAYGLYLLLDRYHFDRYHLAILPAAILWLSPIRPLPYPRWARASSLIFLVLMGLFSLGATRNNLTWNRVRWNVLRSMMQEQGIPADQIDGGLEFNGWYATAPQNPFSFEHKSWWFVQEDQYVLSFSKEIPCSINNTPYPVSSWWPGADTLYVHERPPVIRRDTIYSDLEMVSSDENQLATNLPGFTLTDARHRVSDQAHSGQYAFFLTPQRPYAGKVSLRGVKPCEAITISAWRLGNDRSAGIVASAPDANDFHTFQNVFTEAQQTDGWHRIRQEIRLPADYSSDQLDIYLWNPVNDSMWMDDLQVIWRRIE